MSRESCRIFTRKHLRMFFLYLVIQQKTGCFPVQEELLCWAITLLFHFTKCPWLRSGMVNTFFTSSQWWTRGFLGWPGKPLSFSPSRSRFWASSPRKSHAITTNLENPSGQQTQATKCIFDAFWLNNSKVYK